MGSIFSPPKPRPPPVIQQPVIAPVVDNSAEDLAAAKAAEKERQKNQRGRAATILTSGTGVQGDDGAGIATKTLLGG